MGKEVLVQSHNTVQRRPNVLINTWLYFKLFRYHKNNLTQALVDNHESVHGQQEEEIEVLKREVKRFTIRLSCW